MSNPYAPDDAPITANLPPHSAPPSDPPPPPGGTPMPPDGPIVPHDPPPPLVDVGPPQINIDLPDLGLPDIDIGLPGGPNGIDLGVNLGGDGNGGLLGGGDGLSVLDINGAGGSNALIELNLPIDAEGSIGGDGSHLNIGGQGDGLGLIAVESDTGALVNLDLQGDRGGGADLGHLLNAALLDVGGSGVLDTLALGDVYDGNVPLAGDLSAALGTTLDHLTSSSSLFDVPILDVLCIDGLDS